LADTYHLDWKKEHPELSRAKLESALTEFVTKGRLFEVEGRNKSGKKIWFLSTKPEPDEPDRTGQNSVRFANMPKLHDKCKPDKNEPDKALSGLLSTRNHGTVEPDKISPLRGEENPVRFSRNGIIPPMPIGDENSVSSLHGEQKITPDFITDDGEVEEDENAIYI
jgi:hypothetical protein